MYVANFIRGLRKTFQLFTFSVISVAESHSLILIIFFFFFFLTAANFQLFFLKKMKFWDNCYNFYHLEEDNRSRRHLPHLSKLTSLFWKNMSKFRANNHFVLNFHSQVRKNDFWHICYEVYRFSQLKNAQGVIFLYWWV